MISTSTPDGSNLLNKLRIVQVSESLVGPHPQNSSSLRTFPTRSLACSDSESWEASELVLSPWDSFSLHLWSRQHTPSQRLYVALVRVTLIHWMLLVPTGIFKSHGCGRAFWPTRSSVMSKEREWSFTEAATIFLKEYHQFLANIFILTSVAIFHVQSFTFSKAFLLNPSIG